jgi:regulator of nucleoside diphosphate kinase
MPKTRPIVVTSTDLDRLRDLIHRTRKSRTEGQEYLAALEQELSRAQIVDADAIPSDVVTMNSTVRVRAEGSRRAQTWTIVYPEEADMDEDRISVLAPLGTALLGYRAGDTLVWDVPAGRRRYAIVEVVHQPEAAGEYDR